MVTLILQFEDVICSASLNNSKVKIETKLDVMIKIPLIRAGYSIYYAARGSNGDKVIRFHMNKDGTLTKV